MKNKEQKRAEAVSRAHRHYRAIRHNCHFYDRYPTEEDYVEQFKPKEVRRFSDEEEKE